MYINSEEPYIFSNLETKARLEEKLGQLKEVNLYDQQIVELQEIIRTKTQTEESTPISCKYVLLPWHKTIYKIVGPKEYYQLITNRNQDLVTHREQLILRDSPVAVLGMSVGSNIAITLVKSGISNKIILADFDTLETTNLNRILAGINDIGHPKIDVIARKLYEFNPYIEIIKLNKGVTAENLEQEIIKHKIVCVVEEIDNILLKVDLRKVLRKHKIPTIMATDNGDGIVVHQERYDLDYKLIFGLSDREWDKHISQCKGKQDVANIIMGPIVGGEEYVEPQMRSSVKKVLEGELVSWSQLGSAAIMAGVFVNYCVKQILLRKNKIPYQRTHINPSRIFA